MALDGDRGSPSATTATPSFKYAEYEALRQEILTRNEFRQRTVELTLLSSGAILAAGLKIEDLGPLLLLYPVAVFFLAASWAHNGVGVLLAGSHIREQFERGSGDNGWESAWRNHPLARPFSILAVLSSSGVFLTVQLLTWGLGLTQFQHRPGDWVLAVAGGAAIVATFALMHYYARLQQSPRQT
jgi:hypothetical protein